MNGQELFQEIYNSAFKDELNKIAEDPYKRKKINLSESFVAGLDPTGSKTFQIAQRAERHGAHKATGVAGGVVGGVALVPSTITGIMGGMRGFASGKGRGRVLSALSGFGKGLIEPYKGLYHGVRASRALSAAKKTGKLSEGGVRHLHKAMNIEGPVASTATKKFMDLGNMIPGVRRYGINKAHKAVRGRVGTGVAALGTSGLIGGGSSYIQYGQGKKVGDTELSLRKKLRKGK